MATAIARREFAKLVADEAIRKALESVSCRKLRRAFLALTWEVRERSGLFRPGRMIGRVEPEWLDRIARGLLALCGHRAEWIRPIEGWAPDGVAPLGLFASLAHHLLAEYPVPPVLLSAWFREPGWEAARDQNWFKQAGRGARLRDLGLPAALNRRMLHLFSMAPVDLPVEAALRWAQVRGLGGPDGLARAVAATRLGREFDADRDPFWRSVFLFLAGQPALDLGQVEPIVDYLHDQKYGQPTVLIADDIEVCTGPPRPDLTIRGWSLASLLRRVADWRAGRKAEPERKRLRWSASGIGPHRRDEPDGSAWTIVELLDSDALVEEGRAMDHCVATYAGSCQQRASTIWSLGREGAADRERALTIEVDPATRAIVQAKMKSNEEPDERCLGLLRDWAGQQGLEMQIE